MLPKNLNEHLITIHNKDRKYIPCPDCRETLVTNCNNSNKPHLLIHFIVIFHPPFTMLLVIVFVPVDFLEWGTGPALGGFDYQHFIRMHSYISNIWIPFHLKSSWRLKRLVYHVHFASLFRLLLGRVIAINLTVICPSSSIWGGILNRNIFTKKKKIHKLYI